MKTFLVATLLTAFFLTGLMQGFLNLNPDSLSGFAKCQGLSEDELSQFYGHSQGEK